MTLDQHLPLLLAFCIVLLLFSGLVVLIWGRKLPRQGDWLVWSGLAILLAGVAFSGNALVAEVGHQQSWYRGWIGPREQLGAITVGFLHDPMGLAMSVLFVVTAGVLLSLRPLIVNEPRSERFFSGVAIGIAGTALAWVSLSPWVALIGLSMTVFGGFVSIGSRWSLTAESGLAIRFASERTAGVALAILGLCGIAGDRGGLIWTDSSVWSVATTADSGSGFTGAIASTLLILGLFFQFQPFPFLSWLVSPSRIPAPIKVLLTQILPGAAAFAILFRLQQHFPAISANPGLGWVLVISAALAIASGLLQSGWRQALGAWISAGFSISAAVLCLGHPEAALPLFIGTSLGGAVLAATAEALVPVPASQPQEGARKGKKAHAETAPPPAGARLTWTKVLGYFGAAAATGALGFISCAGSVRWLASQWNNPLYLALFLPLFFLYGALGWKLAFGIGRGRSESRLGWSSLLTLFVLLLLAAGWVWNGTVTGADIPGGVDRVLPSFLTAFVPGADPFRGLDEGIYLSVLGVSCGVLLLASAAGFWLSRHLRALRPTSGQPVTGLERVIDFAVKGYGIDVLAGRAFEGVLRVGDGITWFVDGKVWDQWVPAALSGFMKRQAALISRADERMLRYGSEFGRRWIEVPAKVLQLVQNGDVQWYLFFAVGSGIAMLVHFLRTS